MTSVINLIQFNFDAYNDIFGSNVTGPLVG